MADDLLEFIQAGGLKLRGYQEVVARSVVEAVLSRRGRSFAVMFPRQSGKNEVQAQIEAYLLWTLREEDAELVKVSPTWRPQAINAMRRLMRVLNRNPHTLNEWVKESGFILRVGRARISFFSGAPESNIVGATASTLLEVDEAQNVLPDKFDRDILPMAASTNATRVFWGTAWTTQTLLARELRAAQEAQARAALPEGPVQLAFRLDAEVVAAEVPAYRDFVEAQVARFGRDHPLVRTQYFCEEIDGELGMFTPERVALMQGSHPPQDGPAAGKIYALLLDVAGEDEHAQQLTLWDFQAETLANPGRDSTALTVVEVDLSTRMDALIRAPTYRVVHRHLWTGVPHQKLYDVLSEVMTHWQAQRLVIDATGVGEGLASFMFNAFPGKVTRFVFTRQSKSDLGWKFLAVVENGRWKEPLFRAKKEKGSGGRQERWRTQEQWQQLFFGQLRHCQSHMTSGPELRMRWGVPDGARDAQSGERVHDDLIISAALCVKLDEVDWVAPAARSLLVVRGKDPLDVKNQF